MGRLDNKVAAWIEWDEEMVVESMSETRLGREEIWSNLETDQVDQIGGKN